MTAGTHMKLGLVLTCVVAFSAVVLAGAPPTPLPSRSTTGEGGVTTREAKIGCGREATHSHRFTNTTGPVEDAWTSFRLKSFRIYLHDDFLKSVDLASLECSSGGTWVPCAGGKSDSDGGTRISLVLGGEVEGVGTISYVQWDYGVDNAKRSPEVPGFNDYGDGKNTYDTKARTVGEYLTFDFRTGLETATATTTAGDLGKFFKYDRTTKTWAPMPHPKSGLSDYSWENYELKITSTLSCPRQ